MITVTFLNGCILATAEQSLWQYSYNQQLQINGLELPGVFTVDFCNEGDTTTVAMIGSSGVVDIPNELLTSGRAIVAYVFQKSTLTGGITRCEIRIDVLTRPERDDETPTPEQEAVIDQYIAELNEGVETAETAAANAETSENNAAASAADAQQSKADAAASASAAAVSASDASNSAAAAAQSAINASNSAENAAEAASEGIGYKEDSEAWAIGKRGGVDVGSSDETYHNNSKYYAGQAAASSSAANSEAAAAEQSARDAAASANGAAQSAASATASKNAASNSADVAANAATAAQNHAISAASSATAASGSSTAAANKATAAAQSATEAGNAATAATTAQEAAEDAQDAAEAASQSIAQSAAQIAQNTSDIGDLTSQINTLQPAATAADVGKALIVKTVADGKPTEYEYGEAGGGGDSTNYAPIIVNSASGDIASFADGADGLPVKALSVNVEPIQDLHGFDSPWPAGGGKNLLPPFSGSFTQNGLTGTANSDGSVTVSGTATGSGGYVTDYIDLARTIPANTTFVCSIKSAISARIRCFFNEGVSDINEGNTASSPTTKDVDITKIRLYIFTTAGTSYNFTIYPQVELGSTATAYAPYSNICPISGRTSATVTRTGVNVWDEETEIGKLNTNTGADAPSSAQLRTKNYVPVIGGKTYYFGTPTLTGSGQGMWILFYDDSKSVISGYTPPESVDKYQNAFRPQNRAMTVPANAKYFRFYLTPEYGTTYDSDVFINYPSTYTSYSPYAGNTYTIQLGDTVYGGTLDVTQGKMAVDRAMVDMGTLSWIYRSVFSGMSSALTPAAKDRFNAICSIYPFKGPYSDLQDKECGYVNNNHIFVKDSEYTDAAAFKTAMSGVQLVYELATPIEITLTPTQITTLLGTNNIWSDAGDVSVDYRADTKLYIDNIHTPTDDDMTADAQIASGKYFLIGGNLYKSTTVIPAGDTIRPGTNCIKTNLAEALNALNA